MSTTVSATPMPNSSNTTFMFSISNWVFFIFYRGSVYSKTKHSPILFNFVKVLLQISIWTLQSYCMILKRLFSSSIFSIFGGFFCLQLLSNLLNIEEHIFPVISNTEYFWTSRFASKWSFYCSSFLSILVSIFKKCN